MATHDHMEEIWGAAAVYAEHKVNDTICYSCEGQTRTGTIIWICAPVSQERSLRYIVRPHEKAEGLDVICPAAILIDEVQRRQADNSASTSPELEQALIEMLSRLSLPIVLKVEIDDDGRPFYVWHIGASTAQHPFGLYVGTDWLLLGALKCALEKLIRSGEPLQ